MEMLWPSLSNANYLEPFGTVLVDFVQEMSPILGILKSHQVQKKILYIYRLQKNLAKLPVEVGNLASENSLAQSFSQ